MQKVKLWAVLQVKAIAYEGKCMKAAKFVENRNHGYFSNGDSQNHDYEDEPGTFLTNKGDSDDDGSVEFVRETQVVAAASTVKRHGKGKCKMESAVRIQSSSKQSQEDNEKSNRRHI